MPRSHSSPFFPLGHRCRRTYKSYYDRPTTASRPSSFDRSACSSLCASSADDVFSARTYVLRATVDRQGSPAVRHADKILSHEDVLGYYIADNHSTGETTTEKTKKTAARGDQQVWVKSETELFSTVTNEETSEYPINTVFDIKSEILETGEVTETVTVKNEEEYSYMEQGALVIDESVNDYDSPNINLTDPYVNVTNTDSVDPSLQAPCHSRSVYPSSEETQRQEIPVNAVAHSEQFGLVSTPPPATVLAPPVHQVLQIPNSGVVYQIVLSHNGENSNGPVQYALIQPQQLFIQQTATRVNASSSVVIGQPSVSINQPLQLNRDQIICVERVNNAPTIAVPNASDRSYCIFCYKCSSNMTEHDKKCWANPKSKYYKYRKIAPYPTPYRPSAPPS